MFANSNDIGKLILRLTLGVLVLLHGLAKIASGPGAILAIALLGPGRYAVSRS